MKEQAISLKKISIIDSLQTSLGLCFNIKKIDDLNINDMFEYQNKYYRIENILMPRDPKNNNELVLVAK